MKAKHILNISDQMPAYFKTMKNIRDMSVKISGWDHLFTKECYI